MGPKKKKAKKESKKTETEEHETEEVVVPLRKKPRISDEDAAARLASLADQIKNNIRAGDETKDDEPKKKKQKPLKVRILELFDGRFFNCLLFTHEVLWSNDFSWSWSGPRKLDPKTDHTMVREDFTL